MSGAGLKKCIPTTRSGVEVAPAISVTESADVFVARTASGRQTRSSSANSSRFGSSSSTIASITTSQPANAATSVVRLSSSMSKESICPFSTLRERKCSIRPRAVSPSSSVTSRPTVSSPVSTASCAIPAPIVPSPTTPSFTRRSLDPGRRVAPMEVREGTLAFPLAGDDAETWYRVTGDLGADGPAPLVVLHGGPGATHDYLLSLADLAEGRAVVHYDQLGGGRSTHYPDRGADFWTPELFVRELHNLVEALGIAGRHHVLGQSWGGFLAEEYAFTQPAGLRSLVLANTAASWADFATEAGKLRDQLPADVQATLAKHEEAGTYDDPEYTQASM